MTRRAAGMVPRHGDEDGRVRRRDAGRRKETGLPEKLRALYKDDTPEAQSFRYALLAFDVLTVMFVIFTSFFPRSTVIKVADMVFGLLILADFLIRVGLERDRRQLFLRIAT